MSLDIKRFLIFHSQRHTSWHLNTGFGAALGFSWSLNFKSQSVIVQDKLIWKLHPMPQSYSWNYVNNLVKLIHGWVHWSVINNCTLVRFINVLFYKNCCFVWSTELSVLSRVPDVWRRWKTKDMNTGTDLLSNVYFVNTQES